MDRRYFNRSTKISAIGLREMSLDVKKLYLLFILVVATPSCTGLTKDNPDAVVKFYVKDRSKFIRFYTNHSDESYKTARNRLIVRDRHEEHLSIIRGKGLQIVIREPFVEGEFSIYCYRYYFNLKYIDGATASHV